MSLLYAAFVIESVPVALKFCAAASQSWQAVRALNFQCTTPGNFSSASFVRITIECCFRLHIYGALSICI